MAAHTQADPRLPDPRSDVAVLRAFVAVARGGSVKRAAELLRRTQPSISARLALLERAWKTRLFRRVARGMELTPEGAALLPQAEAVLHSMQRLDQAAGVPIGRADELRIGAGDALGRHLLPRALTLLLREQPTLEIHLREGAGPQLIDAVRRGEIDLALVVAASRNARADGLERRRVARSTIQLLVPAGSLDDDADSMTVRALAGQRLVTLQPGSAFREQLELLFARAGKSLRPAVEVGNLSLVRRFVSAGLGLAAVPAVAFGARERLPGIERRKLVGAPRIDYEAVWREGVPFSPVTRRLLDLIARD